MSAENLKHCYHIIILAIGAIFGLETVALYQGLDGVMFGAATAAIGTIVGGYIVHVFKNETKGAK